MYILLNYTKHCFMWRLPVYMNKHWNIKKIGTPLIKVYLIHVVVDDYDEPLALSLWPNLSGFLWEWCSVSQSASILKLLSRRILSLSWWWYIVPMMWVQNIWTSVDRKRDRQKYILGCGQITMLDSNLGFTPFYLRALNHMCNKYLFCGKFGHHQNISSFVHSPIL